MIIPQVRKLLRQARNVATLVRGCRCSDGFSVCLSRVELCTQVRDLGLCGCECRLRLGQVLLGRRKLDLERLLCLGELRLVVGLLDIEVSFELVDLSLVLLQKAANALIRDTLQLAKFLIVLIDSEIL